MKHITRFSLCAGILLAGAISTLNSGQTASAASAWDYQPGNIMSDAVMRNYGSMDVNAIQSFLKSKNSCNDTRTYIASWYPTVSYHIENGHFVCMADETFNGKSAAQIIYQAAQDFHVNPQVLIVLLQKEQGLVTDTYPHNYQYRTATGYGCPDASACYSKYYGFENQVRNAASLFNTVLNGGWTNYPVGNRYIAYSPRSGCGGTTVNIQNLATSALYRYTPYQPNDAAKNAGYGTGDWCSTYGNRNFYLYFTDWFGSTQTVGVAQAKATTSNTATTSVYRGSPISASSFYLPEGNYQLLTTTGRALDVSGGGTANGANLQIYTKNNSAAQTFHIARGSDGFYRITNPNANKSLDVANADTKNGANVQLWQNNDTCAQKWSITMQDSYYVFRNACSGNALDITGGKISTNNTNVQVHQYNQTKAQTWRLVALDSAPVRGGTYNFKTVNGKMVLDVSGASTANGANIQIWENNNTVAQKFKLARGTDGFYRITNPNADKSLDVSNGSTASGANIQLWQHNDTCAQKWAITTQDKYYVFRNACSGKVIDISGGTINKSGTNVQLWGYNKTDSQLWTLAGRK